MRRSPGAGGSLAGRGEIFCPHSTKDFIYFLTAWLSLDLLCSISPVTISLLSPLGNHSKNVLRIFQFFIQVFMIFDQVSLSLPVLTVVFSVPGARCWAAAPRYSPTKTHMHFESLVKKSLCGAGRCGGPVVAARPVQALT